MPTSPKIIVVDFGSQFAQLIVRRLREEGFLSELINHKRAAGFSSDDLKGTRAIILSGGPASVLDADAPKIPPAILQSHIPILGICYGMQALVRAEGGEVSGSQHREFGRAPAEVDADSVLLPNGAQELVLWMSHGDHIGTLPPGYVARAQTAQSPYALIENIEKQRFGMLFHPEVAHSARGEEFLRNFVLRCGCVPDWDVIEYRQSVIESIRRQVGEDDRVICALSGGVDSAVTARLVFEAIGARLTCVLVDGGILRHEEAEQVAEQFRDVFHIPLIVDQAQAHFMGVLTGVTDPEAKRKAIGKAFIDRFRHIVTELRAEHPAHNYRFLAQGTLYPDVIESASGATTIKSHHNVGGLPKDLGFELIEPLRMLYKDEVRALGRELGLTDAILMRHPFPGPGLAIRIPGEVTADKCTLLRAVDELYLRMLREFDLYHEIWQAFAVLLPVYSTGVMGDARSYESVIALRAVTASDGMTAKAYPFEPAILEQMATRIVNEIPGVNRVVYDITNKPPATIEWE